ncbi:MAG: hypothetical protein ACSI46_04615 [Gloeotrichia echinulata DVL01]|nr:hypothetical protein [Gloeotrichia echinulata DEX184]
MGIGDCTSAPLCYQGLHFGSALLPGIALLCETLRERLRSVTRDWGQCPMPNSVLRDDNLFNHCKLM